MSRTAQVIDRRWVGGGEEIIPNNFTHSWRYYVSQNDLSSRFTVVSNKTQTMPNKAL